MTDFSALSLTSISETLNYETVQSYQMLLKQNSGYFSAPYFHALPLFNLFYFLFEAGRPALHLLLPSLLHT